MALSGSVATTEYICSNGDTRTVVLNWTATQDETANSTTITWDILAGGTFGGYVSVNEIRATIDGVQVFYRDSSEHTDCYQGTHLASGSTVVYHNENGAKTVTISIEAGIYNWSINKTGNKTFTLNTIQRSSDVTCPTSVMLGDPCEISWMPTSTAFYYKLKFSIGNWTYTTGAIHPNQTIEYAYSEYSIPLDVATQIPNSTSGIMTVALYAYSNSACTTQIGAASTSTFTITIPPSVVPSIKSASASIVNSNSIIDAWGIAVAGYTKVKLEASAEGIYGSTITKFTINGGYATTRTGTNLSYTGGTITYSGNKTFTICAVDSRGRSSEAFTTDAITFYSYYKPNIAAFHVERCASDRSKVIVNATWNYASVDGYNSANATLFYKKTTDSLWMRYGTITAGEDLELSNEFDETLSYNFKIIVTDSLAEAAQEESFLSTRKVFIDFRSGGTGLGIGKICESDAVEIAFDAKFYGAIYINDTSLEEYIKSLIETS